MSDTIRNSLKSRGILVPPKRVVKPQSRQKRAIMKVPSSQGDLRWRFGRTGKFREVPYYITSSNCKFTSNRFYDRLSLSFFLNYFIIEALQIV